MQSKPFFQNLKDYVGFTERSTQVLRSFHPAAAPHFAATIDDFYATIEAHPGARAAITGGQAQIERLKKTLIRWLDSLLLGPHDQEYFERRARIGRVHVVINLPQAYMFTAMDRIRVHLLAIARDEMGVDRDRLDELAEALNQILDIELAIMLETYRDDLMLKNRTAERLATIGQFAASIGHELRNPLGVMESSVFLLREHLGSAADEPKIRKHLDRIELEVKRSNKTIHDLLELARNRAPTRHRTDVGQLLRSAIEATAVPAAVQISVSVPDGITLDVDADQFRQVVVNLLTNSIQAMKGAGTVQLEALRQQDPGVGPSTTALRVRDAGPGIPAEVRSRVFEALFTTKAKGSGLGLALCRRIVEAHGGSIVIEPTTDGASFLVTVPDLVDA
ncbi:MAG TPA: protoglobin domain-containing protein [Polyangia bacterium]|nr:protoglobin domain-containing protein [Polyangia bacterium]